jgi:hypothetical protein
MTLQRWLSVSKTTASNAPPIRRSDEFIVRKRHDERSRLRNLM